MSVAAIPSAVVRHFAHATATDLAAWGVVLVLVVGSATVVWAFVRFGGWDAPDAGSEDSGGGGGCSRRRPPGTPPQGGPVWWPEFERQFAEYVAEADRGNAGLLEIGDRGAEVRI